jgi:heterodisulfide reductase subunit A-like polyferredoxin
MTGRTQVVLCRCCTEVPKAIDLSKLEKLAVDSEGVVSVQTVDEACASSTIGALARDAKEKEIDRVVILACSKKDISPSLLAAYRRARVNEFLVEAVNIREEVLLPHLAEPERAQAKAEAKLRSALARARMLVPLDRKKEPMRTRNVVVIGAGVSGLAAAEAAAREGAHTILVEKSGRSVKAPGVVMAKSQLVRSKGRGGNITLSLMVGEKPEEIECAAVVVATGGGWTELKGPLAKARKDAITLYELHERLASGQVPKDPVVIVDTPDPSGKTLKVQDHAWDETLEVVSDLKSRAPESQVYVLFQEMRAFGLSELAYKEAADKGVRFVRYDKPGLPKIDPKEPGRITVTDFAQAEQIAIPVGTLVFASVPPNPDNAGIAEALRLPMSPDGGIRRGSIQRDPVTTVRPGIFVCGSALFPKSREVAEAEGEAAGGMAGRFAAVGVVEYGGSVADVTQDKCSACLTCVRTCPYEAPFIGSAGKAEIDIQLCQGCGMCVGICPSKAIELHHYTDDQISAEVRELLGGDF